jgi:beta-lactamase superfamily II metal-dependent hydrolase
LIDWLADNPKRIFAVVLTHNDADHAGAIPTLVAQFGDRIRNFFMLLDRPKTDAVFDKIFRCAFEAERKGWFQIERVERPKIIWNDSRSDAELTITFPGFSGNVSAKSPNDTSGIISLFVHKSPKVIWPGDCELQTVAAQCSNFKPFIMVGPHHGAPGDYKKISALEDISKIGNQRSYISVGTKNRYDHPKALYLRKLSLAGCKTVCSQLTFQCDRRAVFAGRPILNTPGLLGLRPPRTGVSCRGALRIYIRNGIIVGDGWDDEHLSRISRLRRPQCLASSWKEVSP